MDNGNGGPIRHHNGRICNETIGGSTTNGTRTTVTIVSITTSRTFQQQESDLVNGKIEKEIRLNLKRQVVLVRACMIGIGTENQALSPRQGSNHQEGTAA